MDRREARALIRHITETSGAESVYRATVESRITDLKQQAATSADPMEKEIIDLMAERARLILGVRELDGRN